MHSVPTHCCERVVLVGAVEVRFLGNMDTIIVCCGYFRSTEGVRVHPCQGEPALEKWGIMLPAVSNPKLPKKSCNNITLFHLLFSKPSKDSKIKVKPKTLLDNNCENMFQNIIST